MSKGVIALDVGGTTIHVASVIDGRVQERSVATYPSFANRTRTTIIHHLKSIIVSQLENRSKAETQAFMLVGVGMAFPGPADYDQGISYIQGLDKFEALYGVNVKEALYCALLEDSKIHPYLSNDFSVQMENDATLFALGEFYSKYKKAGIKKCAAFTLGTGIGSTFLEDGTVVRGALGIPASGFIYDVPFKEGIIDDYISKRGIMNLTPDIERKNVSDLYHLALKGDRQAQQVFATFGQLLGEALQPFIRSFEPEVIVFGGQISKSFDRFKETFRQALDNEGVKIDISNQALQSTFIGAYSLVI